MEIGRPKELWRTLKSLGLSETSSHPKICLKKDHIIRSKKTNAETFKDFFSNLAGNLVNELPTPPDKFGIESTKVYYEKYNLDGNDFTLSPTTEQTILKLLNSINPCKAAGLDNLSGKFLKEGANVLAISLKKNCNLSIATSKFPNKCKQAKLKPLFKKGSKTDPKNYRPISLLPIISKLI